MTVKLQKTKDKIFKAARDRTQFTFKVVTKRHKMTSKKQ